MAVRENEAFSRNLNNYQKALQDLIGIPEVLIEKFENWSETQRNNQILSVRPTQFEEVQNIVRACRQLGLRLRAAGATHSWSPMFSDEGHVLMYTNKLVPFDGDKMSLWTVSINI